MRDRTPVGDNGTECDHSGSWRKSSYSMSNGQCVEIARLASGQIGVRDSVMAATAEGSILRFELGAWTAFLAELDRFES